MESGTKNRNINRDTVCKMQSPLQAINPSDCSHWTLRKGQKQFWVTEADKRENGWNSTVVNFKEMPC